tara:strand:+ start:1298 stop:1738 length:441 start_codon:yes stop_codon:yes gene_type:complete
MLIEYDNINKIKTIKLDKFLDYEYKLLKKIIKELLLSDDNSYNYINFDIYIINEYKYYYIFKIIRFFYKIGNQLIKKSNYINIYTSDYNNTIYDYIFSIISHSDLSNKLKINYINNEINWKKTKTMENIKYINNLNNNIENNFIIL